MCLSLFMFKTCAWYIDINKQMCQIQIHLKKIRYLSVSLHSGSFSFRTKNLNQHGFVFCQLLRLQYRSEQATGKKTMFRLSQNLD